MATTFRHENRKGIFRRDIIATFPSRSSVVNWPSASAWDSIAITIQIETSDQETPLIFEIIWYNECDWQKLMRYLYEHISLLKAIISKEEPL